MTLSYRLWLLGALLVPLCACGGAESARNFGNDAGGSGSDASATQMALQLLAPDHFGITELVPGEVVTVSVRITDPLGGAVAGLRLDFALLGQPVDSTLNALTATTDVEGQATVYLRAGQTPTSFSLRVSAASESSYVSLAVVQTSQVPLEVRVQPSVAQAVKNVSVRAFAARSCDQIANVPPSAEATYSASYASATLAALSAGTSYAVLAKATDPTGVYVYSECVEVADPSAQTAITVSFGLDSADEAGGAGSPDGGVGGTAP